MAFIRLRRSFCGHEAESDADEHITCARTARPPVNHISKSRRDRRGLLRSRRQLESQFSKRLSSSRSSSLLLNGDQAKSSVRKHVLRRFPLSEKNDRVNLQGLEWLPADIEAFYLEIEAGENSYN